MSVQLHVDDAGFVRAPAALVYRRLTDIASWPQWWHGLRVQPRPPAGDDPVWAVELAGSRLRVVRLLMRPHGWRHDAGVSLELRGDLVGRGEFWLEPSGGGTVIHHLAAVHTDHLRAQRVLTDYRRGVRRGLWGIKDRLQVETRSSAGLRP